MNEKNERENPPNSQANQNDTRPVIVTIGASAGGVSALHHFFEALPEQSGAAYVVVVHLDPVHRSEMPAILAAKTRMPVVQVSEQQRLEADHVYVIPPDRRLQMVDHEISTSRAASACQLIYSFVRSRNGSAMALP